MKNRSGSVLQNESPLRKTSPFRYAIGMFGTSIPINMFKTFAAAFYVDMLGLESTQFASVVAIYSILDAIDNPVYGYLSDHTRSRWGRRRPWLVIGTPLLILAFLLFYNVPSSIQGNSNHLYIYMLLTYLLTGTLDSMINASYGALFPEIFTAETDRSKTNAMRQIFQLVAMGISIALTPMITDKIGYSKTSLIYGILALIVILFSATGSHENPEYRDIEKPKLFRTILDLFRNPLFWLFGVTGAFYGAAFGLVMQALPFYTKYTLNLGGTQTTIILATVLVVALVFVALWAAVSRRIKMLTVFKLSLFIMTIGFIPMYFVNSMIQAIFGAGFIGIGAAGVIATMDVIGAKVMDDDYRRHGIRREGMFSSAMGVLGRLNGLYVALAFYIMQKSFGFENGDNPGDNPALAAKVLFVVFPCAAMAIGFILSNFIRLKNEAPAKEE